MLGGEQSGHIIFLDHMTTGDGQLAALQFLSIVQQSGKKVSELSDKIVSYPQILRNVRVNSNAEKTAIMDSAALREAITKAEETGRKRPRPHPSVRHGAAHPCDGGGRIIGHGRARHGHFDADRRKSTKSLRQIK